MQYTACMTAKQSLLDVVGDLSEEEAARLLPFADPELLECLERASFGTSTEQLLQLPEAVRELVIRYEARFYSNDDRAVDIAEAEAWECGTGADIDLIDA